MESELKTQISQSAIENIKKFKQDHLLEVLPLIKDAKELHDYISTIENIDYALLEQVFFYLLISFNFCLSCFHWLFSQMKFCQLIQLKRF